MAFTPASSSQNGDPNEVATQAFSGIRVLDLSRDIAGSYCGKMLAGFGADVIKVEPPRSGDPSRRIAPFFEERESLETSILFHWLNGGKRSITLDVQQDRGRAVLEHLLADADVLIESFPPRLKRELQLDYPTLAGRHPQLIVTSISNFGCDGPYCDYEAEEIQLDALSGMMYVTGDAQSAPLGAGPAVCQYSGGSHAFMGTSMALLQRELTGLGQGVDIALVDCGLENVEIILSNQLQLGRRAARGPSAMVPWGLYECRDGWEVIVAMPQRHWPLAREIFDDPRLFAPEYAHVIDRMVHRDEYDALLKPCVKRHDKRALFEAAQDRNLAFGYVASVAEALTLPPHEDRAFLENIQHPIAGTYLQCAAPFKMPATPWHSERAPLLGEHNNAVYGELLGFDETTTTQLRTDGII